MPVYREEDGARESYEQAWENWADLFSNPEFSILLDGLDGLDLIPDIKKYRRMLIDQSQRQSDKELPTNFPLMSLLESRKGADGLPAPAEIITTHTTEARRLMQKGKRLVDTEQENARKSYEEAWAEWARIFEIDGGLMIHPATDDLASEIDDYRSLVKDLGQKNLPDDFALSSFLEVREAYKLSAEAISLADDDDARAMAAFDSAWKAWLPVLEKHQQLMNDRRVAFHLATGIKRQRALLQETDAGDLPLDFPLMPLLIRRGGTYGLPTKADIENSHGIE